MAKIYDLKELAFQAVSGFSQHGTVTPTNFKRCFYMVVLDNIKGASNDLLLYDTSTSGTLLRMRLGDGNKWTKNTENLESGVPVFAPLEETAYLGVVTTGPCNMSLVYADEEGKGVY